jgi:hypothetical protein
VRFPEKAPEGPETAVRLGRRAEVAAQAAVGLDRKRRDRVALTLLHKWQDEDTPTEVRAACVQVGLALGARDEAFGREALRACMRRHSLKAGPGNGSVGMNRWGAVHGPMTTEGEQHQHAGLASHPAWNCSWATPNHPSDGERIQEEAATIASPQIPPVDVTAADWRNRAARGGVATDALAPARQP